ncbi:hypothetical protein QOT17_004893 [Balamuthia mandrillaris]
MRTVSIPLVLQELLNEYKTWEGQPVGDQFRLTQLKPSTIRGYFSHINNCFIFSYFITIILYFYYYCSKKETAKCWTWRSGLDQ